jgi:hypothetical protein
MGPTGIAGKVFVEGQGGDEEGDDFCDTDFGRHFSTDLGNVNQGF